MNKQDKSKLSPEPSGWEKEFDDLFPYHLPTRWDEPSNPLSIFNMDLRRVIKSFIAEVKAKARAEAIREAIEKIMGIEIDPSSEHSAYYQIGACVYKEKIIKLLQSLLPDTKEPKE